MITLYTGTPGSGKSLHTISLIFRCLSWGRDVICNFAVKFTDEEIKKGYDKRFHNWTNDNVTVNNLIEFALDHGYFEKKQESQCLVVIDEAGGKFNTRAYATKDRTAWVDFLSQHRKCGFDFILVAQMDKMIDKQILGCVETEKKHRKCNNFGPFFILPFPLFVCVEVWYTAKVRVGSEFFLYHKKIAAKYDSMKMFEGFTLSKELILKIEERKLGIKTPVNISNESIDAIFIKEKEVE
jgi:Zonula occludens toxin